MGEKSNILRAYAIDNLSSINVTYYNGVRINRLKLRGKGSNLFRVYKEYFDESLNKAYHRVKTKEALEEINKNGYSGYIYIIGSLKYNICKIGYSVNPQDRLKSIQTGCPFDLSILKTFNGTYKIETELHRKYRRYKTRAKGEWFRLEGELKRSLGLS